MAESSTSSGFRGMSGGAQYCYVPECGSARYDKFGNKTHIGLFKLNHLTIRSHKSTSVGSKLLVCIEGEVVETRLNYLAKIMLYVNTILRTNI